MSNDQYTLVISNDDFESGSLNRDSYVKSNRLFTANERIIAYKIGTLTADRVNEVITKIVSILQQ
ncbi:hypothetical protein [Leptolyngbya sp. FACHB-541]|uniref:hypothetical protein n=1 Tax=Leptolyngbya sp. FACHB-541 TaxID=2692810 RepID=UPI00322040C2